MKAMVCEMCSSNDLVKQEGMYVCQHCGTKYAPDEAKKLLVEVSGKLKLDNSENIEKYFELARQAHKDRDNATAAKYYSLIRESDPTNWEAYFFSNYFKAMDCKIGQISSAIISINNIAANTFKYIKANTQDLEEQEKNGYRVVFWVKSICEVMFEASKNHYCEFCQVDSAWKEFCNDKQIIEKCLINYYTYAISHFSDVKNKKYSNCLLKYAILITIEQYKLHPSPNKSMYESALGVVNGYVNVIRDNEPEYTAPSFDNRTKGGCYVATCVYGSYDCPQVWTLRRFRDYTLAKTWYGRAFVRIYYAISPTLVKWFGNTNWFKKLWKGKLDRVIKQLNKKGVENTPYDDISW